MYLHLASIPVAFISGLFIGEQLVRYIAHEGGEERFPQFVQEGVEAYRETYYIDDWE